MADVWRLIDTGLRPPAQNVALDRALLEARRAEESPSTLRFLRFTPCALVGCNHSVEQELDLGYCRVAALEVQRRITGGDPMCLDPRQLAWTLFLHRRDIGAADLQGVSRRLCHAAAAGISALGVDARYRPRNEIEVDGRRIGESAVVLDGDALLFQGAIWMDADPAAALRAIRLAGPAASRAADRVTSLKTLLGAAPDAARVRRYLVEAFESEFEVEFSEGDLTLSENRRYQAALREVAHPDWNNLVRHPEADLPVLEANHPARPLRAVVALDRRTRVVRQAYFISDVAAAPRRAIADLEAVLRYAPLDDVERRIERFFAEQRVEMAPLVPADFIDVVRLAVGRVLPAGTGARNRP